MKKLAVIMTCMLLFAGIAVKARELPAEERKVPHFSGINISVPAKVYIVQGESQKLVVEGTGRVLDNLITEVKGGRLSIHMPRRWNYRSRDVLNVYLVVTELNNLQLSGSGRILTEGLLSTDDLTVTITGSGRIELEELETVTLTSTVTGSGRLIIGHGGKIENHKIRISGSGIIESGRVPSGKVSANITGSGRCTVNASDDLNVSISGSGRVIYTGSPLISSHITGSGRLVNDN